MRSQMAMTIHGMPRVTLLTARDAEAVIRRLGGENVASTLTRDPLTASAAVAQATSLPPTSGNTTTLVLGLVSFSLLFLVVGSWLIRILHRVRETVASRRAAPSSVQEIHRAD